MTDAAHGPVPQDPLTGGSPLAVQAVWPLAALAGIALLLLARPDLVIEVSTVDFVVVTLLLGGGAAWLTGQAIAETWRPYSQLLVYTALLAATVRFFHFALFGGTLLAAGHFAIDFVILAALASLGFRVSRARQMTTQYGWLYERAGPLGWRARLA